MYIYIYTYIHVCMYIYKVMQNIIKMAFQSSRGEMWLLLEYSKFHMWLTNKRYHR